MTPLMIIVTLIGVFLYRARGVLNARNKSD